MGKKNDKLPDKTVNTKEWDATTEPLPDKKVETKETVSPFINDKFQKDNDEGEDDMNDNKKSTDDQSISKKHRTAMAALKQASASEFVEGMMSYTVYKKAGIGDFLKNNWGKILGGIGAATGIGYGISQAFGNEMDENDFAESLRGIGVSETNIRDLRQQAKTTGDFSSVYDSVEQKQKQLLGSMSEFEARNALNSELAMGGTSPISSGSAIGIDNPGSDMVNSLNTNGIRGEITPEALIDLLRMSGQDVSGLLG